ncbi:glycosyltransferase [Sphingobacterium multivorum]|uniref:glycosyltransferase n=1 Tax=Sphingobacterium multivorum TaxID=28454 RepID=UPI000EE914A7|nr:glycosyltransferase [Sphingobacterium multivorum]HAF36758.1 oligosaccharide biosynthesis protein Alg14 [Sphingobacterium sp.]
MEKKILAVASVGGHWVQLLRLIPLFNQHNVAYVSTGEHFNTMVHGSYYWIPDFNRNNIRGLFMATKKLVKIIKEEKPDLVITTGAAPGLLALVVAKLMKKHTIWLDSIANVERLSMSGRIAMRFCSRVYTQWPELAKGKIVYAGNVIS